MRVSLFSSLACMVFWVLSAGGCGDTSRIDTLEKEVGQLKTQVTDLETKLESANKKLETTMGSVTCFELRVKSMKAWSKHKPKSVGCTGGRICRETGLRPNTIGRYRQRLNRLFTAINTANFDDALVRLNDLRFPVPTAEKWYERQSFTKEEWKSEKDTADKLTRRFLKECGGVLKVDATPKAEDEGGEDEGGEEEEADESEEGAEN